MPQDDPTPGEPDDRETAFAQEFASWWQVYSNGVEDETRAHCRNAAEYFATWAERRTRAKVAEKLREKGRVCGHARPFVYSAANVETMFEEIAERLAAGLPGGTEGT